MKVLNRAGFDYELVEDLRPFVVKLSRPSIHTTPDFGCQGLAGGQFYPATIKQFQTPSDTWRKIYLSSDCELIGCAIDT